MLTIIGCGNANRRDDAVGVVIAQRLQERLRRHPVPGIQAIDCGTAGMEVMFAARDSDAVLLVDACRTGAEPGAVFEVPAAELVRERPPDLNLHSFRWDDALVAGERIYGAEFPRRVTVFLIEAEDTGFGFDLSAPVAAAADTVFSRLLDQIAAHAVARHAPTERWSVSIRDGWVQIPAAVYAEVFEDREGVVPFMLEDELCLMPVHQVAGGLLVKLKNPRGDRVIDAAEFLRASGWADQGTYPCAARWERSLGALALAREENP